MKQAQWIWYNGDFELYHSLLLHDRRQEFGCGYPCFWHLSTPYPNVYFFKQYHADKADTVRVCCHHHGYVDFDGKRYSVNQDFEVPAGDHSIGVAVMAVSGLPAIFVDSAYLVSDDSWEVNHRAGDRRPVGCEPAFRNSTDNPEVFPFLYEPKAPVSIEKVEMTDGTPGRLFDFGREMFGILHLSGADASAALRVSYGESREEALDFQNALVRDTVEGQESCDFPTRAFRYICVSPADGQGSVDRIALTADYEYLDLPDRGSFHCNRPEVENIWQICAYTLHLNAREFFLDGIKRDRWCWSGDAYQSYMANQYLFFDPELTKRTIVALLGKPPYEQHVNTINDYSMYLIIGLYEYYFATGDAGFVRTYFDRAKALYDFIVGRLDENGYVCKRDGDWIFIDWSDIDKDGPLCAEQILLWRCHQAMAELLEVVGHDGSALRRTADRLQRSVMKDYWREERGGFIDSFTSGREHLTRHANIFAILYGFVSDRRKRQIVRSVLENDEVTPITTPYFAFFELKALGMMGKLKAVQERIQSYWGGMVKEGATSIWEQFDPEARGVEHYAMYGNRFGCSLCHAWGGGPVYLLGRFCLGVQPTSVGYRTFTVEPDRGLYRRINGRVPMPEGTSVEVSMDVHSCTVQTDRAGGTLIIRGKSYPIPVGEPLTVTF